MADDRHEMAIDLVMGVLGALIGVALLAGNARLADLLKEGDDQYRHHPWLQAFEPSDGPLATDAGRIAAFRGWFIVSGAGFLAVGAALMVRGALAI
jgi:hypothetical protein